mmetsp:Transcript_27874/g.64767  ORF Transcript_27874/g.64767 Transcript_27874/m.64767 type:complete len:257 (-) Transcript_27874:47-817(-)
MEVRIFSFTREQDIYGIVNVGAKVCEVVLGSQAHALGVQPGWYIAGVDGHEMRGAMSNLCRRVPAVTTEEVRSLLKARRRLCLEMVAEGQDANSEAARVEVIFWTDPLSFSEAWPDDEDEVLLEAPNVREFRNILIGMYGSIIAAWPHLDKEENGQIDFREFLKGCHDIGFKGSLKDTFNQLDKDRTGWISIDELDPGCQIQLGEGTRCAICTVPNPCAKHTEEEQKKKLVARRKKIMETGAKNDWKAAMYKKMLA